MSLAALDSNLRTGELENSMDRMHLPRQGKTGLNRGQGEASSEVLSALARLAAIVDSSEDAIISKDLDGKILSWNRGAESVYGYSPEEILGQTMTVLLPPDRPHEEDQVLAKIRSGQQVTHFETVRLKKGGRRIDVSLTISPIHDGIRIVGASHVARDISERKRLEEATTQLAAIVASSDDAIISKDLNGIIKTWNVSAEQIYGYSAQEIQGRSIAILVPPERADEELEILARLRRGERVEHFETTRLRKDGKLIEVSLTISPIFDSGGQIVGASHIARDITGKKDFEAQVRQTQRLESLGVLAGGVAHDFNNLLTGILGNASLISEGLPPSHGVRSHLQDLMVAATRAADLTVQLLAYAGKGQFIVAPINLTELVAEISTLVKASIPKTVNLRLDLDKSIPNTEADRNQLQQVVMNLIINGAEAIEDARPGTVNVRTGLQQLDETYIRTAFPGIDVAVGEYVYIEVRDEGCGMDEMTKARIFEPFFTTKFTGRGLGLAAVLGIIKAHHGTIRVSSALGEGSTFKVFFPALTANNRNKRLSKGPVLTALVVDDEEIIRKLAKATLENHGYRVLLASNGREAVDLLREMPDTISVVILDLTMPVMSGAEALRELKKIRPDVPIILSSGYTEADVRGQFGDNAISGFLQKPYTSDRLRECVRQYSHS